MLKGFKEFILRGNIIELAVAFVVGGAFQKVVSEFVTAVITPLVNSFPGAKVQGWGFALRGDEHPETFINLSSIINALIVFVITAAVIYFAVVAPMNHYNARRARGEVPEPETKPEDIELLIEIRDLLKAQRAGS